MRIILSVLFCKKQIRNKFEQILIKVNCFIVQGTVLSQKPFKKIW